MSMFAKATKRAVRPRIAMDGPSGAGKTFGALTWAAALGKRIAVCDTERGSASLYADLFEFDVVEFSPPFHPDRLVAAIRDAEKAGYDVLIIDSLSHFWEGEGGVLDLVDVAAAKNQGNGWSAWKSGTPVLRHLIDTILQSDLAVIATMRSKTEWVLEEAVNKAGKTVSTPKRVGMAPVMRAGVEYEFTVVGDIDLDHRMTITKTRAPILADRTIDPGRAKEAAEDFRAWMESGAAIATREQVDALKQALNKIEPKEARIEAKQRFAEQFGNPDYLVADRLPEASAFVGGLSGLPEPPDPETPAVPAVANEPEPELPQTNGVAPARAITVAMAKDVHIRATKLDVDDTTLDVFIFAATGGRSDSAKDLTVAEHGLLLKHQLNDSWRERIASNAHGDWVERWAKWSDERDREKAEATA